mgnify:CR=1 FL=1
MDASVREAVAALPLRQRLPPDDDATRWVSHVIGGRQYRVAQPITFTPYAAARPCSARCTFCSENLRETGAGRAAATLRPAGDYFDALRGALEGREDNGGGSWVLIPDAAAKRLLAHLDVRSQASAAGKLGNVVTSMFRRTVLPLSPRWAMGNLVEGALRSAVAGAGPTNYLAGRRILKALDKLDPETAAQARAMVAPGGMYSLGLRGEVRRGLEDWSGDGHLDRFARRRQLQLRGHFGRLAGRLVAEFFRIDQRDADGQWHV